jgi:hypothetical protein
MPFLIAPLLSSLGLGIKSGVGGMAMLYSLSSGQYLMAASSAAALVAKIKAMGATGVIALIAIL